MYWLHKLFLNEQSDRFFVYLRINWANLLTTIRAWNRLKKRKIPSPIPILKNKKTIPILNLPKKRFRFRFSKKKTIPTPIHILKSIRKTRSIPIPRLDFNTFSLSRVAIEFSRKNMILTFQKQEIWIFQKRGENRSFSTDLHRLKATAKIRRFWRI